MVPKLNNLPLSGAKNLGQESWWWSRISCTRRCRGPFKRFRYQLQKRRLGPYRNIMVRLCGACLPQPVGTHRLMNQKTKTKWRNKVKCSTVSSIVDGKELGVVFFGVLVAICHFLVVVLLSMVVVCLSPTIESVRLRFSRSGTTEQFCNKGSLRAGVTWSPYFMV